MGVSAPGQRPPVIQVARVLLAVLGLALIANAVWLAATANLSLGTAMTGALGLGCLVWARWTPRGRRRWINIVALILCATMIAVSSCLASVGTHDTATGEEDAIIVLGAAVHGSELSRTLTGRLDAALAYHARNPRAVIVVTGGQGPQEDLPEAVAMQAYLLAHGVATASIVVEDRATSTVENFAFSKALLDARLPIGYRVGFVTDEFHVYRSARAAEASGFAATHLSSRTPWYSWVANYLREDLAVLTSLAGIG